MHKEVLITSQDLVDWIDRPPSNDDLDLCNYLENAVKNQYKYKNVIDKIKEIINKQLLSNTNLTKYTDEMCLRDILELLEEVDKGGEQ